MTDFHVHIGQWFDVYYSAESVFSALRATGTDEIWFSSTTSGRYCAESPAVIKSGETQEHFPTAQNLYEEIRNEIKNALEVAKKIKIKANALFWVIPEIHKSRKANVSIQKAMEEIQYKGFKLHPRANVWDLNDEKSASIADEVFNYAENHSLLILIHCGEGDFEKPNKFEPFIARHPNAKVQLAHTRPLDMTLEMLKKYPNTFCDTAFTPKADQDEVINAGFADRIRFGTDFPITHYISCKPNHNPTSKELIRFLKNNLF